MVIKLCHFQILIMKKIILKTPHNIQFKFQLKLLCEFRASNEKKRRRYLVRSFLQNSKTIQCFQFLIRMFQNTFEYILSEVIILELI